MTRINIYCYKNTNCMQVRNNYQCVCYSSINAIVYLIYKIIML